MASVGLNLFEGLTKALGLKRNVFVANAYLLNVLDLLLLGLLVSIRYRLLDGLFLLFKILLRRLRRAHLKIGTAKPDESVQLTDLLLIYDCLDRVTVLHDLLVDGFGVEQLVESFLPFLGFHQVRRLHAVDVGLDLVFCKLVQCFL